MGSNDVGKNPDSQRSAVKIWSFFLDSYSDGSVDTKVMPCSWSKMNKKDIRTDHITEEETES